VATTLMQLRRLVRSRLGIPISDNFLDDQVLDDHINLAIETIEAEARWPWLQAAELVDIDADNPDIVPPENYESTRAVMFGEQELALVSPADLLTWQETHADIPKVWCPMSAVVAVRPIPTSPITLIHYFYVQSTYLRADHSDPLPPPQFSGAIVAKAAELLAARESSGGDATRHGGEYAEWVTRMRRYSRRATGPVTVRVRPGRWV
jgi:hypothetical protein